MFKCAGLKVAEHTILKLWKSCQGDDSKPILHSTKSSFRFRCTRNEMARHPNEAWVSAIFSFGVVWPDAVLVISVQGEMARHPYEMVRHVPPCFKSDLKWPGDRCGVNNLLSASR